MGPVSRSTTRNWWRRRAVHAEWRGPTPCTAPSAPTTRPRIGTGISWTSGRSATRSERMKKGRPRGRPGLPPPWTPQYRALEPPDHAAVDREAGERGLDFVADDDVVEVVVVPHLGLHLAVHCFSEEADAIGIAELGAQDPVEAELLVDLAAVDVQQDEAHASAGVRIEVGAL